MNQKKMKKIQVKQNQCLWVGKGIAHQDLETFLWEIAENGYQKQEERDNVWQFFAAFSKEDKGLFLHYYHKTGDVTVVEEEDTRYFSYQNQNGKPVTTPKISQIPLADTGMSYLISLSDGRFIVIDGGRDIPSDAENLYQCLKQNTDEKKPTIAAWILTHPHSDHYHGFLAFAERYADKVKVEKFLFHFPDPEDEKHYPTFGDKDVLEKTNIPRLYQWIEKMEAEIYTPHSGQMYEIGDAKIEILASLDDTIAIARTLNATSLMFRMELGGQVILWTADAMFSVAQIPEKYGDYLKSDILQVPHHGFQSGDAEAEIVGYQLIAPEVCLMPASDYDAYTLICIHRESTRFLLQDSGVKEVITASELRTITLPYSPLPYGREEVARKTKRGLARCGSCSWIFSDLETGNIEDDCFTVLNATYFPVKFFVDIFLAEADQSIRRIPGEIDGRMMKKFSISDLLSSGKEKQKLIWLKDKTIPEDAAFSVRFFSDIPLVVSHKNHQASYFSNR